MKDEDLITPRKRELVRKITELLDKIEELEREYDELEQEFERPGQTAFAHGRKTRTLPVPEAPPAFPCPTAAAPAPARPEAAPAPTRRPKLGPAGKDWPATERLFRERDALRRKLTAIMLENRVVRRRLVEVMLPEASPVLAALAAEDPSPRRDRPLLDAICAQPQNGFSKLIREGIAHCEARASGTALRLRQAWAPVKRIEDRIIAANIGLCHAMARRYAWSSVPYEDLIQEGAVGLQIAVERFDVTRGFRLSTFATNWVRSKVNRAAEDAGLIRLPNHMHVLVRRAFKLFAEGKTEAEVAKETGSKLSTIKTIRYMTKRPISIDKPVYAARGRDDGSEVSLLDVLPDSGFDLEDTADTLHREQLVREAIEEMGWRDRTIIEGRMSGRTLADIARELDLSRERIRQLENLIIKRLKRRFARSAA